MGAYAGPTVSFNQLEIIKNANFFASGGTVTEITQNGVVYRVHTFTTSWNSSTLTVNRQSERVLSILWLLVVVVGDHGSDGRRWAAVAGLVDI